MTIFNLLKEMAVEYRMIEHKRVFTVEDSTAELGHLYPVKNLLLKEEKGDAFVLVVMKGDERLDTKKVALASGLKKLQFAKPEVLFEKLGVTPGSVSLFSLLAESAKDVKLVLDSRILSQAEVGFHPNDNSKTIVIAGSDVEKLSSKFVNTVHIVDL